MQHESHPHDERLSELAAADPQATDDRALRDHVAACDRCRAVVDDLALLRSALAELPDLRPSRPLQLLPPVAAPAAHRGGLLGQLRRLSAPALAAGVGLILVGTVGSMGVAQNLAGGAASGARTTEDAGEVTALGASPEASNQRATLGNDSTASAPPASSAAAPGAFSPSVEAQAATAEPAPDEDGDNQAALQITSDPLSGRLPWLIILGFGVALAAGALLLRFTVQPRAG